MQCDQTLKFWTKEMLPQIISVFVITAVVQKCTGESAFVCTEKETGKQTVHLHCPFGTEIQIKESIYGRNKWRQCLYTVGDCTETTDLSEECCGRRNCNVTVWRIYSIKCEYVTFFRVIYECVEKGEAECKDEEDPDEFDPTIFEITSQMKFPSTSTKLQPFKSTADNQITSRDFLPESGKSDPGSSGAMSTTIEKDNIGDDLAVIIVSAAAIAILLVCIIVVLICLRKFKWQGEKDCFFNLFAGWCKRHPPDGCENPGPGQRSEPLQRDVKHSGTGNDVENQNRENTEKQLAASSTNQPMSHDVNHNNDSCDAASVDKCSDHHYVVFEDIKALKNSNPVLRSPTEGRVVLDQKAYNTTPVVSEGIGITAV